MRRDPLQSPRVLPHAAAARVGERTVGVRPAGARPLITFHRDGMSDDHKVHADPGRAEVEGIGGTPIYGPGWQVDEYMMHAGLCRGGWHECYRCSCRLSASETPPLTPSALPSMSSS